MTEHIKPLLADYLDGELSPPEMERVSTHCAGCGDCRRELDELKSVSQAVCSLPRKALPVGFMQRLERRRRQPDAEPRQAFILPRPARAAAFALSAGLVLMTAYDRLGSRFGAKDATLASPDLTLDEPPLAKAQAKPALQLAKAPGAPLGEDAAGLRAQAQAVALAKAAVPPAGRVAAPAEPAAAPITNEELAAALEAEKKREGIRVLGRQADSERELNRLVSGLGNAEMMAAMRGPAPIDGPTPVLLTAGGAAAVRGGIARGLIERAARPVERAERAEEATAGASGLVLVSDAERAAFWTQRGLAAAPPRVDYEESRLLMIVANDYKTVVEIAGIVEGADRVLVTYRLSELPEGATQRTQAPSYQYRVASKSDKPVQFQRLP